MAKEIKWTPDAEVAFREVVSYLEDKWSSREIVNFITATEKILDFISKNPLMFRRSKRNKVHEALITKHNLLLYRVKRNHIELLTFWDTRKNPLKKLSRKR